MITMTGRGYPTPEAAERKLREMLERDGVTPVAVEARRWVDEGMCPWEAVAWITDEDAKRLEIQRGG